ncbi:MAG: hypothetical protein KatS3mg042_1811 [Rhodothermaceae bacterium]|nr:MAG: hypothetical protein KatS3mg042_1811 [Rhodothermaceae bacterium]
MSLRDNPFILSDPLHDRVVRILLADGVVTREEVEHAWMRWLRRLRDGEEYPLWRELLNTPDVDIDAIFEIVALTYAFRRVHISVPGTMALAAHLGPRITDAQWNMLIENLVVPVLEPGQRLEAIRRVPFATFDPTNPDVRRLVASLNLPGIELCYAPAPDIIKVITEAFPEKKYLLGPL